MTEFQELMLYSCFGAFMGLVIANLVLIIASVVSWIKNKIHKRRKAKESASNAE